MFVSNRTLTLGAARVPRARVARSARYAIISDTVRHGDPLFWLAIVTPLANLFGANGHRASWWPLRTDRSHWAHPLARIRDNDQLTEPVSSRESSPSSKLNNILSEVPRLRHRILATQTADPIISSWAQLANLYLLQAGVFS